LAFGKRKRVVLEATFVECGDYVDPSLDEKIHL
jgi:hypothetical protein